MPASRERRWRRSSPGGPATLIRSVVLAAACTIALAGCSDSGTGSGFDAEPGPIDPTLVTALGDDVDPQAVPAVQRDFLEMCVEGVDGSTEDLAPLERSGLLAVCGCTYDAIVEDLRSEADGDTAEEREGAAYREFRAIESDLRAGNGLGDEIEGLVAACIRDEAGI